MPDGGALGDVIVDALKQLLRVLFSPITEVIEDHSTEILDLVVATPAPNRVFAPPTNEPWDAIYTYYWDTIAPIALFVWAGMIGLVILFESTSHLFSSYHRTKLKKRAFSGLLGILSWWWIAAISLRFTDALARLILPSLSNISLFETLSFTAMGVLGLVIALLVDLILFVLIALIYFLRRVAIFLFVLMMPLLMALWVPGVGPFALVSRFMRKLAGFYAPFLFMTIPVAILFRLGGLLGSSFELSMGGIGAWLTALVIPLVAVLSPIVLFWQAGAIFFVADRASRHFSTNRARNRIQRTRAVSTTTAQGTRNFARGTQGKPAKRPDGQYVLDSGDSRAHRAGKRLNASASRLRTVFKDGGGGSGGAGGGGHSGTGGPGDGAGSDSDSGQQWNRTENFEALRGRDYAIDYEPSFNRDNGGS